MAAEFEQLATDFLTRLPPDHPDRPYLTGIRDAVAVYAAQGAETAAAPARSGAQLPTHELTEPAPTAAPDVSSPEPRERHERRTVRGRVAANPDFRTLPKGSRRGHFPLAEHPDGETTLYWEVYTWNKPGKPWTDRLEALALTRGDYAEVNGYIHPVADTTKDGRPKPAMLYAAAPVKTR